MTPFSHIPKNTAPKGLADTLAVAMEARRGAIGETKKDVLDDDEDDDDWSD